MFFLLKQADLHAVALFPRVRAFKKAKDKGVSWHQGYPDWAISQFITKGGGFPGRGFGLYLEWGGGNRTKMAEKTMEKQPAGLRHRPAL